MIALFEGAYFYSFCHRTAFCVWGGNVSRMAWVCWRLSAPGCACAAAGAEAEEVKRKKEARLAKEVGAVFVR